MNRPIVVSEKPVLLVGGAGGDNRQLLQLLDEVETVVAADSGADWLRSIGRLPDALIGDLDSVSGDVRAAMPSGRVHEIAEQESTDFDKCLRNIRAPLVMGLGFLGARVDHMLAAMTVLLRRADTPCILLGARDAVAHLPPTLALDLPVGTRLSLFPLAQVSGRSKGLEWPIDGLHMAPDGRVGTSNRVTGPVMLDMSGPGMLIILPVSERAALQAGLARAGGSWPVP